jgi:acetyl/propionyl-CoA carboxylase alpha subunit
VVRFTVTGANIATLSCTNRGERRVSVTYTGQHTGTDTIAAYADSDGEDDDDDEDDRGPGSR